MSTLPGPVPGAGTAHYRVVLCDLRTDRVLEVLPVTQLSFDDFIGKSGSLTATVPVPNRALAVRLRAVLVTGRTAVWVERDGDVWWGGLLWTSTVSSDDRGVVQIEIQAGTFDSYLDHRILYQSLTATDVDQFAIARALVEHVQAAEGGDIGIRTGTELSGVRRTLGYSFAEAARVRELLDNLAALENGFEWRIACHRDPHTGRRVKRLQLGHPKIRVGTTDTVLDYPGHVLTYSLPGDSTVQANVWLARGDAPEATGEEPAQEPGPTLSELWFHHSSIAAGWPLLDGTSDHSAVTDPAVLNSAARAALHQYHRPEVIPEVTVRLDGRITPALLGSTIRFRFRDLWHTAEDDTRYRVVGLAVTAPVRGTAETALLYLEVP
ncbi:hypothetical protein [Allostreptomyces psammosilenae]|uniref:Minor tail protein n=1 Tax=Allostreptomyces psammosilenae TaxID=1892865 RepID=A0A852ZSE5_9ACTN|nr:hypothetical protein [Allostreptomyces psammosilenae]NYI05259.1 hypothetical protein [Allostreptomyces psammosilenae]